MTVTATRGGHRISEVSLAGCNADGQVQPGPPLRVPCDALLMCGGYTPSVQLFSQTRGRLQWDQALQAHLPGEGFERVRSAGACAGHASLAASLRHGALMAQAALQAIDYPCATIPRRQVHAWSAARAAGSGCCPCRTPWHA